LNIFGVNTKDLRSVTTTEKDAEKGKSRIPDNSCLIKEEEV